MHKLLLLAFTALPVPAAPLTLSQAVEGALKNYPAVRASAEQAAAALAGVSLARTAYLPRADFVAQLNRATRNNVFGLTLPQPYLPAISGPVLGTNNLASVWGSAAGVLLSWEPFDFGLRRANVAAAQSARRRADAGAALTRFQVAASAAEAFLGVLAADRTVTAARAGVDRARVLNEVVDALARAELRPGADAARTRAELATAETRLIQAEQAASIARASLAQFLGVDPSQLALEPGPLLALPPEAAAPPVIERHPLALAETAAVEEIRARERTLARSYFPRFNLQAAMYGRGTGARVDGTTGGGLSGAGPNVRNWAAGMTVTFPAVDIAGLNARREIEHHLELSEAAQYDRVIQDLKSQLEKATAQLEGARRVARNTPIALDAARAAEQQAGARYKAGLGTVLEVADAQRLLTEAEIEDALARLDVWRALLGVAAAGGDLAPLLAAAGK